MGAANIAEISAKLIAYGMPGDLPVLAVNNATTRAERRLVARLDNIARQARDAAFTGPVLFIIGRVVSLYQERPGAVLARLAADLPREAVDA
jgi:uroporphyrin-III C-methyltransferase